MAPSVMVGWILFFMPLLIRQFVKDEDIRIFFNVVCSAMSVGVFIGHYIDLIYK